MQSMPGPFDPHHPNDQRSEHPAPTGKRLYSENGATAAIPLADVLGSSLLITFNERTKLTTAFEKALAELGGGDPNRTYGKEALGETLAKAVEALIDAKSPGAERILDKIYKAYQASGDLPPDPPAPEGVADTGVSPMPANDP